MAFEIEWARDVWEVWVEDFEHEVWFCPEGADEDAPPTDSQRALVAWLVAHADAVLSAAHDAAAGDRAVTLEVVAIHIHPVEHRGLPYVGVQYSDPEDDGHGAGVLLHGLRVVRVGGADVAILQWMAEEDAETA